MFLLFGSVRFFVFVICNLCDPIPVSSHDICSVCGLLEPWYVLLVMEEAKAICENSALERESLLTAMQAKGVSLLDKKKRKKTALGFSFTEFVLFFCLGIMSSTMAI